MCTPHCYQYQWHNVSIMFCGNQSPTSNVEKGNTDVLNLHSFREEANCIKTELFYHTPSLIPYAMPKLLSPDQLPVPQGTDSAASSLLYIHVHFVCCALKITAMALTSL